MILYLNVGPHVYPVMAVVRPPFAIVTRTAAVLVVPDIYDDAAVSAFAREALSEWPGTARRAFSIPVLLVQAPRGDEPDEDDETDEFMDVVGFTLGVPLPDSLPWRLTRLAVDSTPVEWENDDADRLRHGIQSPQQVLVWWPRLEANPRIVAADEYTRRTAAALVRAAFGPRV